MTFHSLSPHIISVIAPFSVLFSSCSWRIASALLLGAILARGKRTVTTVLRTIGLSQDISFSKYHRILNSLNWSLHRGVIPAWMEIMKLNLPKESYGKVFAWGSAFGYLGDGILPFLFGGLLDGYFQAWRWIFPLVALIALFPVFFQARIPIRMETLRRPERGSFSAQLIKPWKSAWLLMKTRADFRSFQVGFMLGGSGLMVMHAVLPAFFMGVLELSYTELAIALTLCKGIGFAVTSQFWAKWMPRVDIYRFSSIVTLLAFLFPLCLLAGRFNIAWIYTAYIVYGVMQAGSELSWNLSGPIFSGDEDSSPYSSVNVVTVGLRGCIAPGLGSLLVLWVSPGAVLLVGGFLCLLAFISMSTYSRTQTVLAVAK